uniref:Agenet domain-containing protein n=1 Tax=Opuntia streptacantha TaxID=393608 RepID=A0A7C9A042_OPUST
MRFRRGTKVEVLTRKEVPSGSWRRAEIIGGNDHNYTVRYDGDMGGFEEASVEKVPWKAIRPCPPSVDVLEDWVPGDVVEVFHNFAWKMGTVLKMLGWNYLLVRLLGSAIELKVGKHDVRARLCWQDGEWIVIGKASSKCEDLRLRLPSSQKNNAPLQKGDTIIRRQIKGDHVSTRDNKRFLESQGFLGRTLKRKQFHPLSQIEADPRCSQKIRVGRKERIWHPINAVQQPELPEKGHRGLVHLASSECLKMILGSTTSVLV